MPTPSRDDPEGRDLPAPPMARVHRMQLIRREVREYLSEAALEVLFQHAEVVAEGGEDPAQHAGAGGRRVYATIMATIDLRECADYLREPADEATAARVAELLQRSERPPAPLLEAARAELARIGGVSPGRIRVSLQHEARAEGTKILIDGDAMAAIDSRVRNRR